VFLAAYDQRIFDCFSDVNCGGLWQFQDAKSFPLTMAAALFLPSSIWKSPAEFQRLDNPDRQRR
jgi:hypothetical protein